MHLVKFNFMSNKRKASVLFVCMGNICRSPTAEGVFRHVVKQHNMQDIIAIDSAGTHAYHVGEPPDRRAQATAKTRGLDLSGQRARKVERVDFDRFDYVIAMDRSNYDDLKGLKGDKQKAQLHLFMDFARDWENSEVPDPYYGGSNGFEQVFDMVQSASEGLLDHIVKQSKDD